MMVIPMEDFMNNETLSFITLKEFIRTMTARRVYKVESLHSFIYWIRKDGCPRKWPLKMWEMKFNEFLTRKV